MAEQRKENAELQKENIALQATCRAQAKEIDNLKGRVNDLEQYTRINNVIIKGVPLQRKENVEERVIACARAVGVVLSENDIDECHCLPARRANAAPNIVVKLVRRKKKHEMLSAWKKKRPASVSINGQSTDRIYVEEHLSPRNAELYYQMRQIQKERDIRYVWVRDGKIFVRIKDGGPKLRVTSQECIHEIESNSSTRQPRTPTTIRKT